MARSPKSSAKTQRAKRRPLAADLLPVDLEEGEGEVGFPFDASERPAAGRLTAADLKRAAAKARGAMGTSAKLDPSLRITRQAETSVARGMKRSRGASAARTGLDKGAAKRGHDEGRPVRLRTVKSNAEIAEGLTSTARKSPAPRAADPLVAGRVEPSKRAKRTGGTRQRVPAPGSATSVRKGTAVAGPSNAARRAARSRGKRAGVKRSPRPRRQPGPR